MNLNKELDKKLLIKFPTRGRREKFFKVFKIYYDLLYDINKTEFIISCDIDDKEMNNDLVREEVSKYKNTKIYFNNNKSKIEAINNNLEGVEFDIVLLASDDMIPQAQWYDFIIKRDMDKHFPDTDGVLWYNDGYQGNKLNTLCILGKKYYDRFGYIYHPSYKSLWCDNEFMEVANGLNKQKYNDLVIIKHEHPVWTGQGFDQVLITNQNLDSVDKQNFFKRKQQNFPL